MPNTILDQKLHNQRAWHLRAWTNETKARRTLLIAQSAQHLCKKPWQFRKTKAGVPRPGVTYHGKRRNRARVLRSKRD